MCIVYEKCKHDDTRQSYLVPSVGEVPIARLHVNTQGEIDLEYVLAAGTPLIQGSAPSSLAHGSFLC